MNLKDTVSALSAELNIPAKQVRTVARALLEQIAASIESGEDFKSPVVTVRVRDFPETTVTAEDGTQKVVAARRVGILRRSPKKAPKAGN